MPTIRFLLAALAVASTPVLLACQTCMPSEGHDSTAGFFPVHGSRVAVNFNLGWRFHRGAVHGAEALTFDDRDWTVVNAPHGVDGALPEEASGGANYQGPAWYRKKFSIPEIMRGRRISLHFEGILGKSKIWVNGRLLREHCSGFLPAIVDISEVVKPGETNLVAVLADNSDDSAFPPGKPQRQLDYSYFGGMYRDVHLIVTDPIRISDPNQADVVAGGGVFFRTETLDSAGAAHTGVKAHVINGSKAPQKLTVAATLCGPKDTGSGYAYATAALDLAPGASGSVDLPLLVKQPDLWSPDAPVLSDLEVTVTDSSGRQVDAYRTRVGIRTVEIRPDTGLVLNGKPFEGKLIGANRHQDHAVLGFALPNNLHRRDVQKLRDAGLRIIRSAHYPQDPAFMDACDELGMFVIVNTPGWQFWNKAPEFEQRVYSDIRNMVRRDRNHPSVLLWEPILNETHYPKEFAKNVHDITHAEYPHPGCYTAADSEASGAAHFDVLFAHPVVGDRDKLHRIGKVNPAKPYFTREWGDNVDDWSSHNSPSRAARAWGEIPQLVQAAHYGKPGYPYTCWDSLYATPAQHFGGTLWHSFDHQRGYHPDPFFGGIMDAFRRPKYAYELFKAQRPAALRLAQADSGPTVFIAHAMTPFSPADVSVYSNCDTVRLSFNGRVVAEQKSARAPGGMPSPTFTFPKVFDFMAMKALHRAQRAGDVALKAEGLIDGKVVATHEVRPAKRAEKISLSLDLAGTRPVADGSTVVPVIAAITDRDGNIKRLNDGAVTFEVTGEGRLIGDASVGANPRSVKWGEAPALVRLTARPGKVTVIARYATAGAQMPESGKIEFESLHAEGEFEPGDAEVAAKIDSAPIPAMTETSALKLRLEATEKELERLRNREVERQQAEFEKTH